MLEDKLNILENFIKVCSKSSGVYKIFGKNDKILYIGKAKNLKARIKNYQNLSAHSSRIISMISQIASIETIITKDETEALLLESNLIKQHKPKYNILLKDNKTFPYICLNDISEFPRLFKYRGSKLKGHIYYGPFTSVKKLNEAISSIQKIFLLRSCTDANFKSRTRPCILYQIQRCSAPCVGKISNDEYQVLVNQVKDFLSGKGKNLQKYLSLEMQKASKNLQYEKAAIYRDRMKALSFIQSQNQFTNLDKLANLDIVCVMAAKEANKLSDKHPISSKKLDSNHKIIAIQIFFIRSGCNLGDKIYYLYDVEEKDIDESLTNFLQNFYTNNTFPPEILINRKLADTVLLEKSFFRLYNHKVKITYPVRGKKSELIKFVEVNLENNLRIKVASQIKHALYFNILRKYFQLSKLDRIEIYDNSHTSGFAPGGVMVVCGKDGFVKSDYRRYSIKGKQFTQDDYFMLKEVLLRRFKSRIKAPDMMIIDGGKGQLSAAIKAITETDVQLPFIISLAKGKQRNSGKEIIYTSKNTNIWLNKSDSMKQYLQILRDEAHRFAIASHKLRRDNAVFFRKKN